MTYDQQRSQENTMSVLWYQKAAETKALYLQGYNVATDRLKEILQTPSDKSYSIVLDLDETVLDNSPYQVQNVKDGTHSAASAAFHKSRNFVRQHNFQIENLNFQSYLPLQQTVYNSAYLLSTVIYCLFYFFVISCGNLYRQYSLITFS